MRILVSALFILFGCAVVPAQAWQEQFDSRVRFYQTTDFGIVVTATDGSLYAIDSTSGERLWRRRHKGLDETSITPIPSTDLILVATEDGDKSRVEAVDLLSGERIWRSDKVKGEVMQLAVDPDSNLLAVVLVRKARGKVGNELKRSPVIQLLRLSDGEELWKKELKSDVAMMPSRFDSENDVPFTLDNYRAPLILDGRLFVFYEGVTGYDLKSGDAVLREEFGVNESGLALTESDPAVDDRFVYVSGKGKVRAIDRTSLKVEWEAKDLGNAAEMAIVGQTLFVRTGGRFTRLKDGEAEARGPYGVSAIDARTGKVLWRFKDGDRGITNVIFPDSDVVIFADRDEVIAIDARTGSKRYEFEHRIADAQFVLMNETGGIVVGGRDQIAAFPIGGARNGKDPAIWRVRHKAPGRGVLRIIAGVALRAAAIYFRYGSLGTSAINLARGASTIRSLMNLRWSGLKSRFGSFDLTTLASNAANGYVSNRLTVFGIASRTTNLANRISGLQIRRASVLSQIAPSRSELQESFLDRVDPVRRIEKLSDLLLRRKRLAELRGNYMYFFTDLPEPFDRRGLVGVNIHTGRDERFVLVPEPDSQFIADETTSFLFSANGNRISGFDIIQR